MKILLYVSFTVLLIINYVLAGLGGDGDGNNQHEKKTPLPKWDYEENVDGFLSPDEWYKGYPECAGNQQSPIDVQVDATVYDENLKKVYLKFEKLVYDDEEDDDENNGIWSIQNNGKTVTLELENDIIETVFENEKFGFLQMHFHWNKSEHTINGKHDVAELHLVHKSLLNDDKYAVLGFMIQLQNEDNPALNNIIKRLSMKTKHEFKKHFINMKLNSLIPFEVLNYYRYMGSLTTPNCMEGINWFLVAEPVLNISRKQLEVFQSIKSNHKTQLLFNSRPIQKLNDRVVRRSWDNTYKHKHHKTIKQDQITSSGSSMLKLINYTLMFTLTTIFMFNF